MFKKVFILALISGLFSTVISISYILVFKYSPLEADFTEKASIIYLLIFNMIIAMAACFIYFVLIKLIKKENLASFIFGFLFSGASILIALYFMMKIDSNLSFKNENAEMFKDFYYFILAPISFFPALSWFTFKPLFIK
jgi:hypothetical protein